MKTVAMPLRSGAPTSAEIRGFHETRDTEAAALLALVTRTFGTLGLPHAAAEVLKVGAPVLVHAGSGLLRALHPESPGGPRLTHDELEEIAWRAGEELKRRLVEELRHRVTEPPRPVVKGEWEPRAPRVPVDWTAADEIAPDGRRYAFDQEFETADGGPADPSAPPTPLVDPADLEGKTVTITPIPHSAEIAGDGSGQAAPPFDPESPATVHTGPKRGARGKAETTTPPDPSDPDPTKAA